MDCLQKMLLFDKNYHICNSYQKGAIFYQSHKVFYTTQRYIRAQKTRSKCRRRFTALHHHTRTPRLRFPTHNSKFRQEEKKTELYRLIQELCSVLMFEKRKPDKQLAVVEKSSVFVFVC